jgi:hypothetical protein
MSHRCWLLVIVTGGFAALGCGAELADEPVGPESAAAEQRLSVGQASPVPSVRPRDVAHELQPGLEKGALGLGHKVIQSACSAIQTLACAPSACASSLQDSWGHAAKWGCGSEFTALWSCASKAGASCDPTGLVHAPACQAQDAALQLCLPACASSLAVGSCALSCEGKSTFAASCQEQAGALHCACDTGLRAGELFGLQGDCASAAFIEQAIDHCL